MLIRSATPDDLPACLALDESYTTAHVWQIEAQGDGVAITVSFRPIRLPRPLTVQPADAAARRQETWPHCHCMLVATEGQELRGVLTLTVHSWQRTGWIEDLVVAPAYRRQGLGRSLLGEARRWAQRQGLSTLLAQASTQNYPAISFYQECGFTFCGFHERYYPNRDIALFFVAPL